MMLTANNGFGNWIIGTGNEDDEDGIGKNKIGQSTWLTLSIACNLKIIA